MSRLFLRSSLFLLVTGLLMWSQTVFAQDSAVATTAEKVSQEPASKAVIFTTQQDHQNMLGAARHHAAATGAKRQRKGAECRQL